MKKAIIKAIAALMLLAPMVAQGQAPGYLGKRNLVGGGIYYAPRSLIRDVCHYNWNGEYRCPRDGKLGIDVTGTLSWERVASRRLVWGLYGEAYGTGGSADFETSTGRMPLTTRIFSRGIGIGTRHHPFVSKGAIAPYGGYVSTMLRLSLVTEHRYDIGKTFDKENKLGTAIAPSIYLGFGYNIFLTDGLILDLGFRFGLGYSYLFSTNRVYDYGFREQAMGLETIKLYLRLFWLR